MKTKCQKMFYLICMALILSCYSTNAVSETNTQTIMKDSTVERFNKTRSFILKNSNIIYEIDGKLIKIPIFQGNMGDVSYDDFLAYCVKMQYLKSDEAETSFIIKAGNGYLTKTFREFLNFYKGNILKDIEISKPAKYKEDGGALDIYYDFKINGIPFVLHINIGTDRKEIDSSLIKSIFDVKLNENVSSPIFKYRFWPNYTSDEL